jgi:hercynylcysteine S-oxide lyase
VAAAPSEWGPNLSAFSNHGLEVRGLPVHPDGTIDLDRRVPALAGTRPAVVHLTLVASHHPLVQPAAEVEIRAQTQGRQHATALEQLRQEGSITAAR